MSEVTYQIPSGQVSTLRKLVDEIEYNFGQNTIVKNVKITIDPVELKQEETPEQSAKRAAKQQEVGGVAPVGVEYKKEPEPVHKPVKV